MSIDSLTQYLKLQQALLKERAALQARLAQVEQALGVTPAAAAAPAPAARKALTRFGNPMSLKTAVVKVTTGHPLTKPEILAAIKKIGYRFSGKDPMNSLSVVLYTRKQFKNDKGHFSPAAK